VRRRATVAIDGIAQHPAVSGHRCSGEPVSIGGDSGTISASAPDAVAAGKARPLVD
jgi:hypothetical protein